MHLLPLPPITPYQEKYAPTSATTYQTISRKIYTYFYYHLPHHIKKNMHLLPLPPITPYQEKGVKFFHDFYGSPLRKILETLQFFQYTKIYVTIKNVGINIIYRICLLAVIIKLYLLCKTIFPSITQFIYGFFYQKRFHHAAYPSLNFYIVYPILPYSFIFVICVFGF